LYYVQSDYKLQLLCLFTNDIVFIMWQYGSSTEDYLKDGSTPIKGLTLCGDGVFPGIGVPAVALSGASAANSMISPWEQWTCLDYLKSKGVL
jgi:hypothetical protein